MNKSNKLHEDNVFEDGEDGTDYLQHHFPTPVMIVNPDSSIRYVNPLMEKLTGFTREEMLGQKAPYPWWITERYESIKKLFQKAMRQGAKNQQQLFQKKNGQPFWVEITSIPVKSGRRFKYYFASFTDITERKNAEQALKESEKFSSTILVSSPYPITVMNKDCSIRYVNPALESLLGFSKNELIGLRKPYPWWIPENIDEHNRNFNISMHKGTFRHEQMFKKKNGERIWVEVSSTPVKNKGKFDCLLSNFVDITERKKAEEELKRLNEELRNLSGHTESVIEKERENIALEIHDELGQVLTALKMDLYWMSNKLDKKQSNLTNKIANMSNTIDLTLDTVKRICTELRPRLLDDIGLLAAIEWLAQEFQEKTGIENKIVSNVGDTSFDQGRSTAIFRIYQEILSNIFRHANATRVATRLIKNRNVLSLKVSDNGRGFLKEQTLNPRAFGLIGMRERARFWGGDIKINSTLNKGTTIAVTIPLHGGGQ